MEQDYFWVKESKVNRVLFEKANKAWDAMFPENITHDRLEDLLRKDRNLLIALFGSFEPNVICQKLINHQNSFN